MPTVATRGDVVSATSRSEVDEAVAHFGIGMLLVESTLLDTETELDASLNDAVASTPESPPRAEHVLSVLNQLGNRHRLRALAVLYNAPRGLELRDLALSLDKHEDQAQTIVDRLTRAGLVSVLPVLDDETLGWRTRLLTTPAAREWLERVALANGREAVVPA